MIKGEIDRPKLERSLKKLAKEFGDTNAQAVARWGVSTCRDLAVQTQIHGQSGTKKRQEQSIEAGARNVISVLAKGERWHKSKDKRLESPSDVIDWIEQHRTAKNGRTRSLPKNEKNECRDVTFQAAMKIQRKLAGIAKGGWIGAGQDIAKRQTGTDRINIGKNFLSYAQKHAKLGHASLAKGLMKPTATINNAARHTTSKHVMRSSAVASASAWGLKKTLTWYRTALRKKLGK